MPIKNILILFFCLSQAFAYSQINHEEHPKIGLVLSGGGAKGIAHVAVLKELEAKGIKPDYIVGTSFGALVGGLYAIGYTPNELEHIVLENDWEFLISDDIRRDNVMVGGRDKDKQAILNLPLEGLKPSLSSGLFSGQNILSFFEVITRKYNRKMNFDSLPIPFRCVATNIENGQEKVFSEGYLPFALRASMSFPSLFNPFLLDDELYVDGGLVNNFPADVLVQMGAEIIIGVDVGATLYKKEEISSMIQILDQSSSFYNARITAQNKEICDVYIRPDLTGFNVMSFSDVSQILLKGKEAVFSVMPQIDSILYKYPQIIQKDLKKPETYKNLSDTIDFVFVFVNTESNNNKNEKAIKKLVRGMLKLKPPCKISQDELLKRINEVYGSHYFDQVSIKFEPLGDRYSISVTVKEKTNNGFNIGARYDNNYGVNLFLKAEFRNLIRYGSLLELKTIVGQSPQLGFTYSTDRGNKIGLGTSFNYDYIEAYSYKDHKVSSTYGFQMAVFNVFVHTNIGNYNRLVLGAETSLAAIEPVQSISDYQDLKQSYYNGFFTYIADTWDKAYYPNDGFQLQIRGDLISSKGVNTYTHLWARANNVFSLHPKLKILAEGFVGIASQGVDSTIYRYQVGGMANSRIKWNNSFPGLRFWEKGANNVWIASVATRYEFYKNNYLTYTFALAALDNNAFNIFTEAEQFYTGMGLKYGMNSRFGPLELSIDYSFQYYQNHFFLSLGYWF